MHLARLLKKAEFSRLPCEIKDDPTFITTIELLITVNLYDFCADLFD